MKKGIFLLAVFSIMLLNSCNKDDDSTPRDENIEIRVKAYYQIGTSTETIPDNGAKVFVYYGINNGDLLGYNYENEGIFIKDESIIAPDQSAIIEKDGKVILTPLFVDRKIALVVESNYYKGKLASMSYLSLPQTADYTIYFKY